MLGHVDTLARNRISGWAANPAKPDLSVPVRLTINGVRTRLHGSEMREDLRAQFPNSTGLYGFQITDHPLPLSPFVTNDVELVYVATNELLPGGRAVLPAVGTPLPASARAGRTAPIIVTTTGRSGSSLLMARLARHPEILVARDHPHELKLLSYYALAFNTLVSEADRSRSTDPDTMLAVGNRFHVGFNPFNDSQDAGDALLGPFWKTVAPDIIRDCFVALTDAHYARVAQKAAKPQPRFFAEKIGTSGLVRQATSFMYGPVYEIVLVRDPRDIICSSKSFWKRGFADSVSSLRGQFVAMSRPRVEANLRQHIVHYEELIIDPEQTMSKLFEFLRVNTMNVATEHAQERRIFHAHGTSASPEATIGRWRRDLTPEEISIANRELLPFLSEYGYGDY